MRGGGAVAQAMSRVSPAATPPPASGLALAREGADVAVLSRTAGEVEGAAAEIEKLGRRAQALVCDLADTAALDTALGRIFAPPTILVLAAAALYQPKKLQFVSD